MEMTYDGMLVMPSSYAVMDEEEMTYAEGGGLKTLKSNLYGLYGVIQNYMCKYISGATIGRVLANAGLTWSKIGQMAGSYWKLAGKITSIISSVTKWLGAHAVAIGVGLSITSAFVLWNFKIF